MWFFFLEVGCSRISSPSKRQFSGVFGINVNLYGNDRGERCKERLIRKRFKQQTSEMRAVNVSLSPSRRHDTNILYQDALVTRSITSSSLSRAQIVKKAVRRRYSACW